MAGGQPDRRVRRAARRRRPGPRARAARRAARLEPAPSRRGLDLPRLARRARWPRREPDPAGHLLRGVRASRRARPGLDRGRGTARPDPDRVRHAGAARALPAADPGRPRAVVPGLLRTRGRLRPGRRGHPGGPSEGGRARGDGGREPPVRGRGGWAMGDQRAEDLDLAGPPGRLVLRAGQDRSRLPARRRPVLPAGADGPAGDHGPPDPAADRHRRVQRGLLRRRAHPRGQRGRGARRWLAGRQGDAGHRARRGHARPAGRVPPRARGPGRRGPAHRGGPRPADPRQAGPRLDRPAGNTVVRAGHAGRRRPGPGLGAEGAVVPLAPGPRRAGHAHRRPGSPGYDRWQRLFLFSRADTIYGGSDEIQHDIIATRALGLPRS